MMKTCLAPLLLLGLFSALLLSACDKKAALSLTEKWQNFCLTYESAAYNIMSDRQHDISADQAIEHLQKLPEGIEQDMLIQLVQEAQHTPKYDQLADKEQAMEQFKTGKYQNCMTQQPTAPTTPSN